MLSNAGTGPYISRTLVNVIKKVGFKKGKSTLIERKPLDCPLKVAGCLCFLLTFDRMSRTANEDGWRPFKFPSLERLCRNPPFDPICHLERSEKSLNAKYLQAQDSSAVRQAHGPEPAEGLSPRNDITTQSLMRGDRACPVLDTGGGFTP